MRWKANPEWPRLSLCLVDPAKLGLFWGRAYQDMLLGGPGPVGNLYIAFTTVTGPAGANLSYVDDAVAKEAESKMMSVAFSDTAAADRYHKDFMKYALEQAWAIPGVVAPGQHAWYPWVKNYHGEMSMGYTNAYNYLKYIWLDQDLKKRASTASRLQREPDSDRPVPS